MKDRIKHGRWWLGILSGSIIIIGVWCVLVANRPGSGPPPETRFSRSNPDDLLAGLRQQVSKRVASSSPAGPSRPSFKSSVPRVPLAL